MKRVLNYNGQVAVVKTVEEAKAFIEGLGFMLNPTTEENVLLMFGELEHNHFNYFFYKNGYPVECLKPIGIRTGMISFRPTDCDTTEEFESKESEKNARWDAAIEKVMAAATEVKERLSRNGKVEIGYHDCRNDLMRPYVSISIRWDFINKDWWQQERFLHVNLDTMMEEDLNVNIFDYLKTVK